MDFLEQGVLGLPCYVPDSTWGANSQKLNQNHNTESEPQQINHGSIKRSDAKKYVSKKTKIILKQSFKSYRCL